MLLYQLLRPKDYLFIEDRSKWQIDWLLPLIIAVLCTSALIALPIRPQVFEGLGLMNLMTGVLQILPGFYLSALAAVATFDRPAMDNLMPAPTPTLRIKVLGEKQDLKLTRRRMLSMLFGYLTFLCFGLYLTVVIAQVVAPSLAFLIASRWHRVVADGFLFVFFLGVAQLGCVTLFGLYQLSDRMHQPE